MTHAQTATAVLMVEPTTFGFDEQTAATNAFQHHLPEPDSQVTADATAECNNYVQILRGHDISVITFRDADQRPKPNAVFPNNWLTTWPDGTIYTYPMATPSRRVERSMLAIDTLRNDFIVKSVADLSGTEQHGVFLEGTGAIVFDHINSRAFACISPRCDAILFASHARQLNYQPIAFHAVDPQGTPIYHSNVMLAVQTKTAVLYSKGIADAAERAAVLQALRQGGRTVISITYEQLENFCGNILEVRNKHGEHFVILSQHAYDHFTPAQRKQLSQNGMLLPVAIPTIEAIGGGSARCMLAEVFLPSQKSNEQ